MIDKLEFYGSLVLFEFILFALAALGVVSNKPDVLMIITTLFVMLFEFDQIFKQLDRIENRLNTT